MALAITAAHKTKQEALHTLEGTGRRQAQGPKEIAGAVQLDGPEPGQLRQAAEHLIGEGLGIQCQLLELHQAVEAAQAVSAVSAACLAK